MSSDESIPPQEQSNDPGQGQEHEEESPNDDGPSATLEPKDDGVTPILSLVAISEPSLSPNLSHAEATAHPSSHGNTSNSPPTTISLPAGMTFAPSVDGAFGGSDSTKNPD